LQPQPHGDHEHADAHGKSHGHHGHGQRHHHRHLGHPDADDHAQPHRDSGAALYPLDLHASPHHPRAQHPHHHVHRLSADRFHRQRPALPSLPTRRSSDLLQPQPHGDHEHADAHGKSHGYHGHGHPHHHRHLGHPVEDDRDHPQRDTATSPD